MNMYGHIFEKIFHKQIKDENCSNILRGMSGMLLLKVNKMASRIRNKLLVVIDSQVNQICIL